MYLIDHVAELRFVNWLIYAIKGIYTHCMVDMPFNVHVCALNYPENEVSEMSKHR